MGGTKDLSPGCSKSWDGWPLGQGWYGGLLALGEHCVSSRAPGLQCRQKGSSLTGLNQRWEISSLNYSLSV